MTSGVEAEEDFGPWWIFDADALGADGNTPIGADLESGAHAPNIRPPRAARHGAQDRTSLPPSQIPGTLRGLPEFTVRFLGVVMPPQRVDANVTNNHPILTGRIVLAHLKETLDYYVRLRVAEIEGDMLRALVDKNAEKLLQKYGTWIGARADLARREEANARQRTGLSSSPV
jgi:hypothetical protein